jgi:hypothetical protein
MAAAIMAQNRNGATAIPAQPAAAPRCRRDPDWTWNADAPILT